MVDDPRTVLASRKNITHAGLVNIKAAQLGYLSFILLSLIKLDVLGRTLDMPLKRLALLGLWCSALGHLLHLGR